MNSNTYGHFNTRRWILTWRHFRVFAVIQTPLHILTQLSVQRFQILLQEARIISAKINTKSRNWISGEESRPCTPNSLDQHFARLKCDNCQAHEQPDAIGPFRVWIVRCLAHALNKYFVSKLFSLNTLPDNILNGLQFSLCAQLTACIFAQILK